MTWETGDWLRQCKLAASSTCERTWDLPNSLSEHLSMQGANTSLVITLWPFHRVLPTSPVFANGHLVPGDSDGAALLRTDPFR